MAHIWREMGRDLVDMQGAGYNHSDSAHHRETFNNYWTRLSKIS